MANKTAGQCDGRRYTPGEGDALVRIGCYRPFAFEDGVRLGAGATVGDVEASAAAFVSCGSGFKEGFQRARDPGAGISCRGRS